MFLTGIVHSIGLVYDATLAPLVTRPVDMQPNPPIAWALAKAVYSEILRLAFDGIQFGTKCK